MKNRGVIRRVNRRLIQWENTCRNNEYQTNFETINNINI